MSNPWVSWMPDPFIAPKEVRKTWTKANPPKTNQKKETGVSVIKSQADIDF